MNFRTVQWELARETRLTGGVTNCASSKFMIRIRNFEAPTKGERSSREKERAHRKAAPFLYPFAFIRFSHASLILLISPLSKTNAI